MSLLDVLKPCKPPAVEKARVVRFMSPEPVKTEAQRRAQTNWYQRNKERLKRQSLG